jgi:hypothetical protein
MECRRSGKIDAIPFFGFSQLKGMSCFDVDGTVMPKVPGL